MSFFLNRISLVMKSHDTTLLISKQITKVVAGVGFRKEVGQTLSLGPKLQTET